MSCRIKLMSLGLKISPIMFHVGLLACQNEAGLRDGWQETETDTVSDYISALYLSELSHATC